jgi:isopenicillin N synthase-like dioxygenase
VGRLPVIDVGRLRGDARDRAAAASAIDTACRQTGFFYASGHGVDPVLGATVD